MTFEISKIIYNNLENDVIKPHLIGQVFHITPSKNYLSIISDGCIYSSNSNLPQNYPQTNISYGLKNNCVCLLDYRKLNDSHNEDFFKTSTTMFYEDCYIFVLDKSNYHNLITEISEQEGYLIPEFECWYKDKITLDKISKIYHIMYQRTEKEQYDYDHSILGMAIKYEKALKNGSR